MSDYDELLEKALISIESTFCKRAAMSLLSNRDAILPTPDQTPPADGSDFDLVTWLLILNTKRQ